MCGFESALRARHFDVCAAGPSENLPQALLSGSRPDIALLDITAGLTFGNLTEIHSRMPECPVVLWADVLPLDLIFRTLELGVRGIVSRISTPDQLAESLNRVASGEMQIGFQAQRETPAPKRQVSLTPREREIVMRLRQGLRNKQIAAEMNITEGTVKIYLFRLFHKLGVRNRFELARSSAVDQMNLGGPPPAYLQNEELVQGEAAAY
jgi:DNA-binding NarL/FixJ family response regulator